jgi:hypothetical protein
MKRFLIAFACFVFFACALVQRGLAQSADEPATRDDVILYLRTMHSHDMFRRTMEVQSQAIQQLLHDQMVKDTGSVPAEFDARMKKCMEDLDKNMPIDQITEAMIPAYQSHFTKGDLEAMNAFYSSPVGQKVLEQLPAVMQEGMQAALPIMSNYLSEWKARLDKEFKEMEKTPSSAATPAAPPKN